MTDREAWVRFLCASASDGRPWSSVDELVWTADCMLDAYRKRFPDPTPDNVRPIMPRKGKR